MDNILGFDWIGDICCDSVSTGVVGGFVAKRPGRTYVKCKQHGHTTYVEDLIQGQQCLECEQIEHPSIEQEKQIEAKKCLDKLRMLEEEREQVEHKMAYWLYRFKDSKDHGQYSGMVLRDICLEKTGMGYRQAHYLLGIVSAFYSKNKDVQYWLTGLPWNIFSKLVFIVDENNINQIKDDIKGMNVEQVNMYVSSYE